MRDTSRVGEIARRICTAGVSVTEADHAGHGVANPDGEHQRRAAGEPPMQVCHAARPWVSLSLTQNGTAERRLSRAHDLRHRAVKIVAPDVIHALQRAQQPVAGGTDVCRCDADDRASGHHEHDSKVRELGDHASSDLPNGSVSGSSGGSRDRRSRCNSLVHVNHLGLKAEYQQITCNPDARTLRR